MENANKPASSWPLKQGPKKWSKHGCDKGTLTVATGLGTHKEKKVWVDIHVQAAGSQICLHNMCGQQRNSPMADPIFGSKYGPQNGVQNWITFSFLLLGLCLGPVLGSRFGPKSGVSHRRILLLPAEVLQADLRRTSMSVSVNTCFFSLCAPLGFLYSTNHDQRLIAWTLLLKGFQPIIAESVVPNTAHAFSAGSTFWLA